MKFYVHILILISITSISGAENQMIYGEKQHIISYLDKDLYSNIVEQLPILCVDVLVYNYETRKFLLAERTCDPAKGLFWVIGGRLYKNESFFECAKRKCLEEVGLIIEPVCILDAYSLIFDKSAWNCPTHTPTIAILAFAKGSEIRLEKSHTSYKWVPIEQSQEDAYLEDIRKKSQGLIDKAYYILTLDNKNLNFSTSSSAVNFLSE